MEPELFVREIHFGVTGLSGDPDFFVRSGIGCDVIVDADANAICGEDGGGPLGKRDR
jgi:hypothetical protein